MRLRDMQVGSYYYQEPRQSEWDQPAYRDIENRTGRHRARLESLDRFDSTGRPSATGAYVAVTMLGGSGARHPNLRRDRTAYVTLLSLRGEWDRVYVETQEIAGERRAREAARQAEREARETQGRNLQDRAQRYGLAVRQRSGTFSSGNQLFQITGTDLGLFLDALDEATRNLPTTTTGGTE